MICISKYGAKKVIVDGIKFDSKMEADFYLELKLAQKQGKIIKFELQPRFELQPKFQKNGKTIRKIEYVADFIVYFLEDNIEKKVIYDVKGFSEDKVFLLKKKMFDYNYPELTLICITYYNRRWMSIEEKQQIIKQKKKR